MVPGSGTDTTDSDADPVKLSITGNFPSIDVTWRLDNPVNPVNVIRLGNASKAGVATVCTIVPPPPNMPALHAWMSALPAGLQLFSGTAEALGALGLILPGLFKIQTKLTTLAAAGLGTIMIGAIFFHLPRGEFVNIGMNVFFMLIAFFIAYMRWKKIPLTERE